MLLWLICLFSCNTRVENGGNTEKKSIKPNAVIDTVVVDDTTISEEINPFRYEKLKEYGDSINSYFQTFGWGKKDYKFDVKYDTIINENNIEYAYRKLVPFSVYVFDTEEEATDYFNELMTIEFVSDFGINKKPNYIFVDANRVVWLKMEHAYVHRSKKIINIFSNVFGFPIIDSNYYKAKGFKRCIGEECNSSDMNLKKIYGIWYANKSNQIDTSGYSKYQIDTLLIQFTKDSVKINNESYLYNISSARAFPNAKHYWEYNFVSTFNNSQPESLTPQFYREIQELQKIRSTINTYFVRFRNTKETGYFTIAKTNNNEIYITLYRRFYILHRK
ncbi:hypothetical protein WAF17_14970 [Bernardetia sp. ABR2-2B]|uniref:hypothetical protein n=1 Tax=Bernardetia sp. ABR2-2B TaxID=3127472 RepID=UPI0030CCA787